MHFSYTARFVAALVVTIGVNCLLFGYRDAIASQLPSAMPINVVLAIVLLASIIWVLSLAWGLVLRTLLWLRAGKYGSYRTSWNTSVQLFGKHHDPRARFRTLRIRHKDNTKQFYDITRGLTVVKAGADGDKRLGNREVAALRSTVEEMINNSRAHRSRRVTT